MTHQAMVSYPSTASSAWLLRGGRGFAQGASPPAQFRDAASGGEEDRCTKGAAGAHGAAHSAEEDALGRVLVVDDEMLVRRTLALFLTKAGFNAIAVEGSAEALDLLRTAGETFDLLVTDQSMPGMTGCELIAAARGFCPDMPVLLVSGYNMSGGEQLPDGVPLLRKPVERKVFLGQVRALLGIPDDEHSEGL